MLLRCLRLYFLFCTDDDFLALGNTQRQYMQQITKMEVAPWVKDYTIDVDKV